MTVKDKPYMLVKKKKVIKAVRRAAELTDNALQEILNGMDKKKCLHIILKGSVII